MDAVRQSNMLKRTSISWSGLFKNVNLRPLTAIVNWPGTMIRQLVKNSLNSKYKTVIRRGNKCTLYFGILWNVRILLSNSNGVQQNHVNHVHERTLSFAIGRAIAVLCPWSVHKGTWFSTGCLFDMNLHRKCVSSLLVYHRSL